VATKGKSNARRSVFPAPEATPVVRDAETKLSLRLIKQIDLKAQTPSQRFYIKALRSDVPYIVGSGPAGTGKTYAAVVEAIAKLVEGSIDKIILTRPMVSVAEEQVGILPGGIIEKISPWCIPLLDIFKEYLGVSQVKSLLEREVLEIAPLAFMRGRTLKNAVVLVDEAQNCVPDQLKMLLTRIGENARMFITGDIEQTDRRIGQNGLLDLINRIERNDNPNFAITFFGRRDIVRHSAIESVLSMYD